jgi:hypothetical protein
MKHFNTTIKKWCLAALMFGTSYGFAATFTAIASGNWTSNATWQGGLAPGTTINNNDDIIINSGVTVSMDQDVTFNGFNILVPGGSIQVNGTLTSTNNSTLSMNNGDLMGSGTIDLYRLEFSGLSTYNHTGSATVGTFQNSNLTLSILGTTNVSDSLILEDGSITISTGGTIDLSSNSNVKVNNGAMTINGGTFTNVNAYNTYYVGTSKTTGIEATGSGMTDMMVMLDNGESLSMGSDINAQGNIMLSGGNLDLNGFDLTISNDFMTSNGAMLEADANSALKVFTSTDLSSNIAFASGSETIGSIHVDDGISGNYTLTIESDVNIANELYAQRGDIKIDGNYTLSNENGAELKFAKGMIVLSNGANFDGSNSYNVSYLADSQNAGIELTGSGLTNVTLDMYDGNAMLNLMSDVTLNGDLDLNAGALMIGDHSLTLNGDLASTSEGSIAGNSNSNLVFSSVTGLSDTVNIDPQNNTFNKIHLNFTTNSDVMLDGDLMVDSLDLSNGSIVIFDNELMMGSNAEIMGTDEDHYIKIDGQGKLSMAINGSSQGYVTYPVGTTTSYSPAHLELNGTGSEMYSVNVKNGVLVNGNSGYDMTVDQQLVDRTWDISSSTSSTVDVNMKLNWSAGMEVNGFDRTDAYITHYTNGNWDETASASAVTTASGMFELSRNNISSLSPFAITDKSSTVDIEENNLISSIYPNPTSGLIYIELSKTDEVNIELLDASGRIIKTMNNNGSKIANIDLSNLPEGFYFIRITEGENLSTKRIIKS